MTSAEQREFLTHTRLYLSKDVKRVVLLRDVYVLKHTPTGCKMRVSAEELFVLGQFGRGVTLAELVPQLIMNRRCLPLAELYELVMQARASNILNEQRDEEFTVDYPLQWWPSLSAESAQIAWMVVGFCAVAAVPFGSVSQELLKDWGWRDTLFAWLGASVCASVGSLLASAYAHHAGVSVRRPTLIWKSLVPRIGFDWMDVDMVGNEGRRVAAKLRILPFLLVAAICAVVPDLQILAPVAVAFLFWRISPFPFSAASQWVESSFRRPLLSTERPHYFYHYGMAPMERMWREVLATDWGFVAWIALWSAVWSLGLVWFLSAFLEGNGSAVFAHLISRESLDAVAMLSPLFAGLVIAFFAMASGGWWRLRRRSASYGTVPASPEPGGDDILQVIEDCLLFRELPAEVRVELVKMARVVRVKSGQPVVGVGEAGADFYVIASGHVQVELERPHHKPDKVAVLHRGDVFGSFGFFGVLFRTQNMRAVTDVSLVAISSPELEHLLKRHISIPVIEEIVQRRAFLRRIALSAGWDPASIGRFSKSARMEVMREGQPIIGAGRENRFFYLVYDGGMEVKRRGRRVARIAPGEFFGEMSLLLNNLATADINTEVPSRCLVLQKSDFLQLMGGDIELALQMEHVASSRLGRPIFPFEGSSIEAIAN